MYDYHCKHLLGTISIKSYLKYTKIRFLLKLNNEISGYLQQLSIGAFNVSFGKFPDKSFWVNSLFLEL